MTDERNATQKLEITHKILADPVVVAGQIRRAVRGFGPRVALGLLTTRRRQTVDRHRKEIIGVRALHRAELARIDEQIETRRAALRKIDEERAADVKVAFRELDGKGPVS